MTSNNQVARVSLFLIDGESFSFESHLAFALCSGSDFHLHLSVQGVNDHLTTQHGRKEVDVEIGIKVIAFALELRVIHRPR